MIFLIIFLNFLFTMEIYLSNRVGGGASVGSNAHLGTDEMLGDVEDRLEIFKKEVSGVSLYTLPFKNYEFFRQREIEKGQDSQNIEFYSYAENALERIIGKDYLKNPKLRLSVNAGLYTARSYTVESLSSDSIKEAEHIHKVFFLKETKKDMRSAQRLIDLQKETGILRKFIQSSFRSSKISNKALPIIAWIEAIFIFEDQSDKSNHVFEMTHLVPGESIELILDNSNEMESEEISHCAYRAGLTLGNFQQLFINYHNSNNPMEWTTICHGDFHGGNVFFDKKTSRVFWIDHESMEKDVSILQDLQPLADHFYEKRSEYYFISFYKGYLDAYTDPNRKIQLANFLKEDKNKNMIPGDHVIIKKNMDSIIENINSQFPDIESHLQEIPKKAGRKIYEAWKNKKRRELENKSITEEFMKDVTKHASSWLSLLPKNQIVTYDSVEKILGNRYTKNEILYAQAFLQVMKL